MSSLGNEGDGDGKELGTETLVDLFCSAAGDCGFDHDWRRGGNAFVELACADAVWVEASEFVAGDWAAGIVPDIVWRLGRKIAPLAWVGEAGTLGADDAGRAGEVPAGHAGAVVRSGSA